MNYNILSLIIASVFIVLAIIIKPFMDKFLFNELWERDHKINKFGCGEILCQPNMYSGWSDSHFCGDKYGGYCKICYDKNKLNIDKLCN